ncbi:MAG: hypothetical protein RJB13_1602 [Pseudomonadota bacterium]
MNFFVIRHGQTDYNAQRRFQGQADIPLNDNGRDQARRAGLILQTLLTQAQDRNTPVHCFTSDLLRTQQTTEIVLPHIRDFIIHLIAEPRLREFHCGLFENKTYEEFVCDHQEIADTYMKSYENDRYGTQYPGLGGESRHDVMMRVGEVLHQTRTLLEAGNAVLWVAHGGVIDVLLELMHIQLPKAGSDRISAGNGDVLQFSSVVGKTILSDVSQRLGHSLSWQLNKHYKIGSTVAAKVIKEV